MRILFDLHADAKFPLGNDKDPHIEVELDFPCRVNIGDGFPDVVFIIESLSEDEKEWMTDFWFVIESIGFEKDDKGIYQYAICCGK